jgi:hypothetical protein
MAMTTVVTVATTVAFMAALTAMVAVTAMVAATTTTPGGAFEDDVFVARRVARDLPHRRLSQRVVEDEHLQNSPLVGCSGTKYSDNTDVPVPNIQSIGMFQYQIFSQ